MLGKSLTILLKAQNSPFRKCKPHFYGQLRLREGKWLTKLKFEPSGMVSTTNTTVPWDRSACSILEKDFLSGGLGWWAHRWFVLYETCRNKDSPPPMETAMYTFLGGHLIWIAFKAAAGIDLHGTTHMLLHYSCWQAGMEEHSHHWWRPIRHINGYQSWRHWHHAGMDWTSHKHSGW